MDGTKDLCQACGLCCDGSLFQTVRGGPFDHHAVLLEAGLVQRQVTGKVVYLQPCAAHVDGRCQVYSQRPDACREFRCLTLQRHDAGELTLVDALDLVQQAMTLKAEIRAHVHRVRPTPELTTLPEIESHLLAVAAAAGNSGPVGPYAPAFLAHVHLRRFLDLHFARAARSNPEAT